MKLDLPVLTATAGAVLFQATAVMADDTFTVIKTTYEGFGGSIASAAWNRGNANDIRSMTAGQGCSHHPYVPWPDVHTICWDWVNERGHIKVGNNFHCFKKRNMDVVVHPNRMIKSTWNTEPCTWSTS